MSGRDLFESSAVPGAALGGDAARASTTSPAGAGCCETCGEGTVNRATGYLFCAQQPRWVTMSPRASCHFTPARWIPITPEIRAKREAQAGIDQAADAADRAIEGWTGRAYDFIRSYAEQHRGQVYIGHDIVQAAKLTDLPQPANLKAWGKPIQRAARDGIIKRAHGGTGAAPDPNRHGNLVPLWETV